MAGERILKLLMVASIFVAYSEADTIITPANETTKRLIEMAKIYKHPRCFTPPRINCNVTQYPGYDLDIIRWYYRVSSRVCYPMFVPRGENKACPGIIDWVIHLPYTKKECEDLCGEPCIVIYANNKTEPGICMMNCEIPLPHGAPFQCLPSRYGCCPRDYETPTIPTIKPAYTVESTFLNMMNINKSVLANFTVQKDNP